ncbi:unnamed protein product [Adineta steineri]|uniref:RING-CH-type domain-containing protein n=1 Tax=Adineta steineri TaxID=433720 RepID=A0A813Y0P5_9BILA|nr:unnamed protein product [Adineta steineri]CAF3879124.1 unnamed protein product [Adineta steineri]
MTSVVDINILELANDPSKQCRICLDNDNPSNLISPCLCSGSQAYVHRKCLNDWRSKNANGQAFKYCNICQFNYIIETVMNDRKADRKRLLKYHLYVFRDLISIILLIQLIIINLAFLLKIVDKNSHHIKNLFPNSINEFVVYYLTAFILLMAIFGLFIFIILFYIGDLDRHNCNSTRKNYFNYNQESALEILFVIIIMVLICAFIGMFIGIILSIIILKKIMKHHTETLWLQQEAEKYIVKDFQERRHELENYKRNLPIEC